MPKTPPLILPSSFPSWFNTDNDKPSFEKRTEELQHILDADISSFTYTPSDEEEEDDDISDLSKTKFISQNSNRSQKSNLHLKPSSNKSSQQRHESSTVIVNENNSEQYQLEDDEMDDMLESQQHIENQQNIVNDDGAPTDTQQNEMEDDTFYVAIDQLTQEYQAYAEEYREFKRHVDSAKRELLDYINQKTPYFEERGAYLGQKWESLKEFI